MIDRVTLSIFFYLTIQNLQITVQLQPLTFHRQTKTPATLQGHCSARNAKKDQAPRVPRHSPPKAAAASCAVVAAMRAPVVKASSREKQPVKRRGRPPKSGGKKSQLALLGGCSPGNAFVPHVLRINQGEDITFKIRLLSEMHGKSICILSANGTLSSVTLRLSSQSGGLNNAVYQGHFEIISLKGCYLLSDEGSSENCDGGLSIVVSIPCGSLFGGSVGGPLIVADPVQVIAGSFNYRVTEGKETKTSDSQLTELNVPWEVDAMPYESFSPLPQFGWSRIEDVQLDHHGFDLTNG